MLAIRRALRLGERLDGGFGTAVAHAQLRVPTVGAVGAGGSDSLVGGTSGDRHESVRPAGLSKYAGARHAVRVAGAGVNEVGVVEPFAISACRG
jgi:hypothetical protein